MIYRLSYRQPPLEVQDIKLSQCTHSLPFGNIAGPDLRGVSTLGDNVHGVTQQDPNPSNFVEGSPVIDAPHPCAARFGWRHDRWHRL